MYTGPKGEKISALPFETEEVYYLIRMTVQEARQIIREDDDYDDDGRLREDFSLDELDLEGISEEDDASPAPHKSAASAASTSSDEEDDDYIPSSRRGRRKSDEDDEEDY